MWSDMLYLAERAHLARVLAWGTTSVLAGTLLVLLVVARRKNISQLVLSFAVVTGFWGLVHLAIGFFGLQSLQMRDLAGFTSYDRSLWLGLGLDMGVVGVGVALAAAGWAAARSQKLMGAGTATVVQGLARLALHGAAISALFRLMARD